MAYIGKEPQVGNYSVLDALSASSTASYTMQLGSTNFTPESANHLIVSLNGVIQKPGSSYTVSGSTITFSSSLTSSDSIDFIIALGNVLDIGTPSDSTVTAAKIGANAVTAAKLNNDIVSGLTALGATPADTDEFLVSDAGTIKRVDYSYIKGGYTQSSVLTPTGSYVEFDNIPSGTNSIVIKSYALQWAGTPSNIGLQLGDSGGYETSGYSSIDFYRGHSAGDMGTTVATDRFILAYGYSGTDEWNGNLFLNHVGSNRWVATYTVNDVTEYIRWGSGKKTLSGELTKLKIFNSGGENNDGGNIQIMYQ